MKKIILVLSLIACTLFVNAQGPGWIWATSSGGGNFQYANGLAVDTSGHFFIGGRLSGSMTFGSQTATGTGADNPYVGGFDTTGNCTWLKAYSFSDGFDYPWGFCKDKDDNVYQGGVVNSGGNSPMFIEKYDKYGNQKWYVTLTGGGLAAMGLAVDGADNVYVTGAIQNAYGVPTFGATTLNYTGSNQAMFVAKMDTNGNWLWAKLACGVGVNDGYDVGRGITVDQYANVYVTGGYYNQPTFGTITPPTQSGNPYPSLFVAEYDSSGNALKVATATNAGFNNGDCCTISHITVDSCGYFYVTGYFQGTAMFGTFPLTAIGSQDVFVAKCSNDGVWQWANSIGSSGGGDNEGAIALDKYSDVYAGGSYVNGSATLGDSTISGGDIYIAKYANSTGALLWVKSQNGTTNAGVGGLAVDKSNYMYVTGDFDGTNLAFGKSILSSTSNDNVFVAKLDTAPPRQIIPTVYLSYCPGSVDSVHFTIRGPFNTGNVFTAQLSDSTGSFVNAVNIGTDTTNTSGTMIITIPSNTPSGSTYLIRVISSSPAGSSWANGCGAYYLNNVYPNDFYITIGKSALNISVSTPDTAICLGAKVQLKVSGGGSGATYLWTGTSNTTDTLTVSPTKDTSYQVQITNGGCTGDTTIKVTVNQAVPLPSESQAACGGSSIILTVPTSGSNYVWTPDSTLNTYTGDTVIASPTVPTVYFVTGTDSLGCTVTASDTISIIQAPNKPTITIEGDSLVSSASSNNQWYFDGSPITDSTRNALVIKGHAHGWFKVVVTNPANGCTTTSDSTTSINQVSAISNQLTVYPNPFSNNIFVKISSGVTNVGDWSLQLTNVLGQALYTNPSLTYNNEIDLSSLPAGVYFITITDKTTGRAVLPVVKQN